MCPIGFCFKTDNAQTTLPSYYSLVDSSGIFPACHKEQEAVLLNNSNDILLSQTPIFGAYLYLAPANGNK